MCWFSKASVLHTSALQQEDAGPPERDKGSPSFEPVHGHGWQRQLRRQLSREALYTSLSNYCQKWRLGFSNCQ